MTKEQEEKFWARVDKTDGCWVWNGYISSNGYAMMQVAGHATPAHRLIYEHTKEPIPTGLVIDHLCRVRHCVNPEHLEAVTNKENIQRGWRDRLNNRCLRGHPFDQKNTYYRYRKQDNLIVRDCRKCGTIRWAKRYYKKKLAQKTT